MSSSKVTPGHPARSETRRQRVRDQRQRQTGAATEERLTTLETTLAQVQAQLQQLLQTPSGGT